MITLFEKFKQEDFLTFKEKEEKKLQKAMITKFGKKNMENFVRDGDIEGVKFLLNNKFDLLNFDSKENLLVIAIKNNNLEMLNFLLDQKYATGYKNQIDSIHIPDIIGQHDLDENKVVTEDMIEKLKVITKYGYNFEHGQHNLIYLYLTESAGYVNGKYLRKFIDGLEPFIDWLLDKYPENYKLCKDYLPSTLKNKYNYLENSTKYNI